MDIGKIYYDSAGMPCNILQIVKREPEWAANRIQEGEIATEELQGLRQDDLKSKLVEQLQNMVDATSGQLRVTGQESICVKMARKRAVKLLKEHGIEPHEVKGGEE